MDLSDNWRSKWSQSDQYTEELHEASTACDSDAKYRRLQDVDKIILLPVKRWKNK